MTKKNRKYPLFHRLKSAARRLSGIRFRGFRIFLNLPDRTVLEEIIIPNFVSNKDIQKVLFVGCDWYTKPYENWFQQKEYWTIEPEPKKRKFGSKNHVVDRLQSLADHFQNEHFDLIICNGVLGWGINTKKSIEESITQCYEALNKGGFLLLGWNDMPEHMPFQTIEECESLKKFEPYFFEPLGGTRYQTPNTRLRHTFSFYRKPPRS